MTVREIVTVGHPVLRERARGGQSFVVVPRIEDLDPLEARLRKIAPELGLVVAHGKMPAADLDEAMVAFAGGDGDVLLATNIIEAGLDVPRASEEWRPTTSRARAWDAGAGRRTPAPGGRPGCALRPRTPADRALRAGPAPPRPRCRAA